MCRRRRLPIGEPHKFSARCPRLCCLQLAPATRHGAETWLLRRRRGRPPCCQFPRSTAVHAASSPLRLFLCRLKPKHLAFLRQHVRMATLAAARRSSAFSCLIPFSLHRTSPRHSNALNIVCCKSLKPPKLDTKHPLAEACKTSAGRNSDVDWIPSSLRLPAHEPIIISQTILTSPTMPRRDTLFHRHALSSTLSLDPTAIC